MIKKIKIIISICSIFFLVFFQSCLFSVTDNDYIEVAQSTLKNTFGGDYTFVSIQKGDSNKSRIVILKAKELNGKNVRVKINATQKSPIEILYTTQTNYCSVFFEQKETEYFEEHFSKYFSAVKIHLDNSNRYLPAYVNYSQNFEAYIQAFEKLNNSEPFIDMAAVEKTSNLLTWEDELKASLQDFNSLVKICGTFYLVKNINESYKDNYLKKAWITSVYSELTCSYKYSYGVIK